MGKGGYPGGSTTIGPGSGWFTFPKPKPKKEQAKPPKRSMKEQIAEAAESLAQAKAEYDAGLWKGVPGRKKARKPKPASGTAKP